VTVWLKRSDLSVLFDPPLVKYNLIVGLLLIIAAVVLFLEICLRRGCVRPFCEAVEEADNVDGDDFIIPMVVLVGHVISAVGDSTDAKNLTLVE
jgi:hypothetical protein